MHFYWPHLGGAGLYLPFNAWGWVFASLVIGLGLWEMARHKQFLLTPLQAALWVGASGLLLPMVYPGYELQSQAMPRLLGLVAGLLFLLCLYQWPSTRASRGQLLDVLLAAVAIEVAFGLVQFFLLRPGNGWGYDAVTNRPYGIFSQPNVMASFLASGLGLAIWRHMQAPARHGWRALRCAVILGASWLLVLLESRVGQLGALLAVLMLWPALLRLPRRQWVEPGLCLALGLALGLLCLSWGGTKRGLDIYQSAGLRPDIWGFTLQLIARAPWAGWGYGSFEATFLHQYAASRLLDPSKPVIEGNLDHPHNEVLYWAMEGGLAPVLGMAVMVGALLWRIWQVDVPQRLALLALLTPIVLHTQTEYPFYHAIALWWMLWILVYVVDHEVRDAGQMAAQGQAPAWGAPVALRLGLPLRLLAFGIPMVVLPFMLTALHTCAMVTRFEASGRQETSFLRRIINPLAWLNRVELEVHTVRLIEALQAQDRVALQTYVDWASGYVRHTPRARVYSNMVTVLAALGQWEQAKVLQARALVLYPGDAVLENAHALAKLGVQPAQPAP